MPHTQVPENVEAPFVQAARSTAAAVQLTDRHVQASACAVPAKIGGRNEQSSYTGAARLECKAMRHGGRLCRMMRWHGARREAGNISVSIPPCMRRPCESGVVSYLESWTTLTISRANLLTIQCMLLSSLEGSIC